MCGIAGYVRFHGPPEPDELLRMAESLRHRGPDDLGVYANGPAGLAHARLSIIDLAGGHQPLFNRRKTLALAANGEIYNYLELRARLREKGADFLTHSDSETILQAYAVYGNEFLTLLHGMYAFAIWDAVNNRMVLGRDRLGIKPLYYLQTPDRFAFASEIKTLLPMIAGGPAVNPRALLQFLQHGFSTGPETIVRGIKRVLPGEALTVDASGRIDRRTYWSITDIRPFDGTCDDALDTFDRLIDRVMTEHVRSDVPYGLFLSGGVDSGTLLSLLARYQDHPVRSFSVGYRETAGRNELTDAARISRLFGTRHTALLIDKEMLFRRIPHMVWAADELMRDFACLPTSILAEAAAGELKVVFTGEGGDEVFAGYGRYRRSRWQRFVKNLRYPGSDGFRTRNQWPRHMSSAVFGAELKEVSAERPRPMVAAWQTTPPSWSFVRRAQGTDLLEALPNNLLVKVDRMLMAFGLEGRVPFLDHRVVEFGLSLPDRFKVKSRRGKIFLKKWAEPALPADHLHRKKRGFHVPTTALLTEKFLARLEEKLTGNPAVARWFDPQGIKKLFLRHGRRHDMAVEIWSLMQFAMWHRIFIDDPGRKPSTEENPLDWMS